MTRVASLAALLLVATGGVAGAQEPRAAAAAALRGVVEDSVRGGSLTGATISVMGSPGLAFTDSAGRFELSGIAPGEYQVALFDAFLDTLGLSVVSPPLRFTAGDTVTLQLAIPSPRTIIEAKCGTTGEPAALFGRVLDAITEEPVAGARVILAWVEVAVSQRTGIRHDPRQRVAVSDAQGYYRLCGLPADLEAEAYAELGAKRTGFVQIAFDRSAMAVATLLIPPTPPPAATATDSAGRRAGPASVRGEVTDAGGSPVANAHVMIVEGNSAAVTDSTGTFSLTAQPAGTQALVVRRLGFQPRQITVNLSPRATRSVSIRLDRHVPVLEEVRIEASSASALSDVGFTQRKQRGTGQYLDLDDIRRRNASRLVELFSGLRGLRVVNGQVLGRPTGIDEGCVRFFIDGQLWYGGSPSDFMMPDEVAAIEVYSTGSAPAEFASFGDCQTAVIWTKWRLRR